MYRRNEQHLQIPFLSSLNGLPEKQLERLKNSWVDIFYREFFVRIDETGITPIQWTVG